MVELQKAFFFKKKKVAAIISLISQNKNAILSIGKKYIRWIVDVTQKRFIFEESYSSYDKRQKSCTLIVI